MEEKKVLIVEDDITLSEMYKLKFQKEGFDVEVSENGFDALVRIQNFKPDVILLDIMMPDIDGFETLKVIREQTALDTKIIMFSNLNRQDDIDKALSLGADDYLIKANVTPKEAVERVREMMNSSDDEISTQQEGQETETQEQQSGKQIECPHCHQHFHYEG